MPRKKKTKQTREKRPQPPSIKQTTEDLAKVFCERYPDAPTPPVKDQFDEPLKERWDAFLALRGWTPTSRIAREIADKYFPDEPPTK